MGSENASVAEAEPGPPTWTSPVGHVLWQTDLASGPLGAYLGNMGHVGEAVGQLLVGMDGVHSSWLGEAALRGLGRRSRWQRGWCACQGPWVIQILLGLSTAQVWGLPRLVLLGMGRGSHECHPVSSTQDDRLIFLILQPILISSSHPVLPHTLRFPTAGTWTGLGAACWDCGWLPVGVVAGCGWWAWSGVA